MLDASTIAETAMADWRKAEFMKKRPSKKS